MARSQLWKNIYKNANTHTHTHTHTHPPPLSVWTERDWKESWLKLCLWPSNPTPGHILGENHKLQSFMNTNVHCSTVYNSQDMEAT